MTPLQTTSEKILIAQSKTTSINNIYLCRVNNPNFHILNMENFKCKCTKETVTDRISQ